jgi:hypothetical protein
MAARFLPLTVLLVVLVFGLESTLREFSSPFMALAEKEKREKMLEKRLQAHRLLLEAQTQMFDRLFLGDMALREAVSEIRTRTSKNDLALLVNMAQLEEKRASVDELLCQHVLRMVRNHVYPGRPASERLLARLEAELAAHLRERAPTEP